MKVQYNGPSDFQEFDAADLKKSGVEGFRKTSFAKGVPVEVDDEVGAVLVSKDDEIFGDFNFEEVTDDGSLEQGTGEQRGAGSDEGSADGEEVAPATGDSTGTGGPASASTGRGTSTARKTSSSRSTGGSTP